MDNHLNKKKYYGNYFKQIPWFLFVLVLSIFYAVTINLFEFTDIPETHLKGYAAIIMQWIIVSLVSTGVIGLISANRVVFAILFPILYFLSVVEVFYRHSLGVGITGTTIEIAIENNLEMWLGVINIQLFLFILLSLLISIGIVIYRWTYVRFKSKFSYPIFMGCCFLIFCPFIFSRLYGAVSNRMPLAIYNGTKDYLTNRNTVQEQRNNFAQINVEKTEKSPNIILVIGESLRGDHLPMNGYKRNTMQKIEKEKNMVSFSKMRSTGKHTFESLPYLLTRADSLTKEKGYEEQSFITLFKNAGFVTSWLANQDISTSYSYFAHETDTLIHINSQRSLYSYDSWLDSDILPHFRRWKNAYNNKPFMSIIHSIGSHWWYKSHYNIEDAIFKPEIDSKEINVLTPQQLINSYDNTIIATDKFLFALIEELRQGNNLLIYISDHGESLGDDGRWLHGADGPELHDVACLIWFSDIYKENYPRNIENLKNNSSKRLSSDALFYTILELADLKTSVLDLSKSWVHGE